MYKIQGTDGRQYGPVSAEVVRQWISQGRIAAATLIQAEGSSDWRAASQFAEFADVFSAAPPAPVAATVTPPLPPAAISATAPPKTSGLAIASLVLGILTVPTCGLGGILGLILGIVSLVKISNSNGRLTGKGMAITGLCLSCFFLFMAPGFFLPALAKAKSKAQRINCVNNLKQIGLGARTWADSHGGQFPPDLFSMENELPSPKILACPSDPDQSRHQNESWTEASNLGSTYEWLGARKRVGNPQEVIVRCPIHNNVGLADGSVQQRPSPPRTR